MNFEYLNGLLQDKFQLDTFCSFLKNGEQKSFKLISVFQQILDEFDPDSTSEEYDQISSSTINDILSENHISSDINVTLSNGFTTVGDIVNDINTGLTGYMNGSIPDVSSIDIHLKDAAGNLINNSTFAEVMDDFKNSIGSSVLERAAIQSASEDNIADKIAKFSTIAENSINVNSDIFNNTINYYKTMLINKLSGIEIINKVFTDSGSTDLASGDPVTINEYPIYEYTGCSPLGTISLNTFSNALDSAGKIVGATCNAIWNGIKKVGKWIWGKAKKYTTEVFSNPYDITDNGNNNTNYCFNGFQYQTTNQSVSGYFRAENNILTTEVMNRLESEMNANANQWYFMQTIGGEMAVKFSNVSISFSMERDTWILSAKVDTIFKPYSLAEISDPNYDPSAGMSISDYLLYMNSQTGDRYLSTNNSEHDLLNSFMNGAAVHWGIVSSYVTEALNDTSKVFPNNFVHYTSGNVTNKDVFEVATGMKQSGYEPYRFMRKAVWAYNPQTNDYSQCYDIAYLGFSLVLLIANLKLENDILSQNTEYYVPYMKEDFTMSEGRFGIKTDSQNQDIATAIAGALIIITAVTLVIITGKVILNKLAKKNFWKRTEFIGQCDNAMWNGQTLTNSQKRKYIRYSRKLNASTLLTKGLAMELTDDIKTTTTTLFSNIVGDSDNMTLSNIYHIIK